MGPTDREGAAVGIGGVDGRITEAGDRVAETRFERGRTALVGRYGVVVGVATREPWRIYAGVPALYPGD